MTFDHMYELKTKVNWFKNLGYQLAHSVTITSKLSLPKQKYDSAKAIFL